VFWVLEIGSDIYRNSLANWIKNLKNLLKKTFYDFFYILQKKNMDDIHRA